MDLSYLQDPAFWIAQCIISGLFMFTRMPTELISWRIDRAVRHAAFSLEDCVPEESSDFVRGVLRRARELEHDCRDAPRLLRPVYAFLFIREVRRVRSTCEHGDPGASTGGPEAGAADPGGVVHGNEAASGSSGPSASAPAARAGAGGEQPNAATAAASTQGVTEPAAATIPSAQAKVRKSRARTAASVSALCARLTSMAGWIVGGDFGLEYLAEMARDLADVKKPVFMIFYALSNVLGAVRLRLILRTGPFLREVLLAPARQWPRRALAAVDWIMASSFVSGTATGLTDVLMLLGTGAWFGRSIAAWSAVPLVAGSCLGITRLRTRWRRLRAQQHLRGAKPAEKREET